MSALMGACFSGGNSKNKTTDESVTNYAGTLKETKRAKTKTKGSGR